MPLYVRTLLLTGPLPEVEAALDGHRQQLRELKRDGKLRVAGALSRGDGFLEIFEAADLHEAERICGASPLIELGLGTWMLREWTELDL